MKSQNEIRFANDSENYPPTRRLQIQTGVKYVLVLRGKGPDAEVTIPEAELAGDVFGTDGDPLSMSSQYAACSYDQLQFVPTTFSSDIIDGVYTVNITDTINGANPNDIMNSMKNTAATELGASLSTFADYIMCCVPPGTVSGIFSNWLAYVRSYPSLEIYEIVSHKSCLTNHL